MQNMNKMSSIRASFKLQSIGYYPRGKAVYLTVTPENGREGQSVSVLLDRTDSNLEKIGNIIRDQSRTIRVVLDSSSRTVIPDKVGRDIVRFRATDIEEICEPSNQNFFSQALN